MATNARMVRRGLPRWPGSEPWPPAGERELAPEPAIVEQSRAEPTSVEPSVAAAAPLGGMQSIRRGLPRVSGGEPWPAGGLNAPAAEAPVAPAAEAPVAPVAHAAATRHAPASESQLRRGLPRLKGGEPWPPAGVAPAHMVTEAEAAAPTEQDEIASAPAPDVAPAEAAPAPAVTLSPAPTAAAAEQARRSIPARPHAIPAARADSRSARVPPRAPGRFAAYSRGELLGFAIFGGFALLLAAVTVVVAAAWFRNLPAVQDFLTAYPGEYDLPEGATPGFPAWVQWQHFFNVFLMVLIIRSGLQVRTEKRPGVFWRPKWTKNGKGKISLTLWFHQSLDIVWLANGLIFVVLLFVTGHWMRIVPTSWEVFPNAFSALLQYASLNWPTENGWVNYNSLQQLMYFLTVFIAAPLAAVTGVRMSGLWPKNAKMLNRIYPVEWARAIHFPVMLYFVAFIIVHVALVFATGALRNLNHMYGGTDAVNWTGFWIFFGALLIIVGGWIAARPLVLAPIAKLSGTVTGR